MKPLVIDSTETTPYVLFDNNKGIMEIKGASFDEDSPSFYNGLYTWLDEYQKAPNSSVIINLHFKYLNSSSNYSVFELLRRIDSIRKNGTHITINWFYAKDDDDIKLAGEEFSELLNFPFNIKMI